MQNNKKYWLRGLTIGIIITGISLILLGIVNLSADALKGSTEWISWVLVVPSLIPMIILSFVIGWGHTIIGSIITYPLLGLIIGWIYGKIKNRNKI
jgi:membrane-associated HD superfamily phosphohydrolase